MRLLPKLPKWFQKAKVDPIGVNAAEVTYYASAGGGGNWLGGLPALSHGYVHEPFVGAWQRNLEQGCHASILGFSAVYACVSIISSDIAKLPILVMKRKASGGRELFPNHPISRLMWTPNHYQTRIDFIQQLMVSLLLTGNAYIWLERDQRKVVANMYVLHPGRVKTMVAETGDVFYQVAKDKLSGVTNGNDYVTIPDADMIHHRLMTVDHPLMGVTPLYAAGVSAAVGARIINSSSAFFGNQARPSGILVAPGRISKETAASLKEQWESNFSGTNAGRTAVLSDGLKWESLTMSAVDAQLIEQLKWSREDVALVYRVPMFLLGGQVTYNNSEQLMRAYYSGCLQYHIEALESRFDAAFGLASDVELEFDLAPLLRTETTVRYKAYQIAIQSGLKTINECRAMEDDAPIEGGDEPLVQKQYVPLSMLAEVNKPVAGAPAAAPVDDSTDNPDDTTDNTDSQGDGIDTEETDTEDKAYDADSLVAIFDTAIARESFRIAA
jgi:HK97 family phage portal protein